MAKDKERKIARVYYVDQGKTAKEIAKLLNITEKTIGSWVNSYGWKNARNSKQFSAKKRISNIENIISNCAEAALALDAKVKEAEKKGDADLAEGFRTMMAKKADEAAKWNKALESLEKDQKVSLEAYCFVMEDIFQALHQFDPLLFIKTIDFQETQINKISKTY